jgi:hypothetical protein
MSALCRQSPVDVVGPRDPQVDPDRLIERVLAVAEVAAYPVHDVFLVWLLSLDPEVDPSRAAATPLRRHGGHAADHRLLDLLREASEWPGQRLAALRSGCRGSRAGDLP